MVNIGILGSGNVGQILASGFIKLGYEVMIGTRNPSKLKDWLDKEKNSKVGSFKEAASYGDIIILCVKGTETENVIELADENNFSDKIVIDVTNPLIHKANQPPELAVGYPDSNGKMLQDLLPDAKVVKAFNIVTANYMCNPKLKDGSPDMFIAGDDNEAKSEVSEIISKFGWSVIDIGDISQSYLLEALAMIWIRYGVINNHWTHAFKLLKK